MGNISRDVSNLIKSVTQRNGGADKARFNITDKISKQMGRRGWTKDVLDEVVNKPYATREAVNKATGNKATIYFNKDGSYVVRDNVTGDIIQVSNRNDPGWIPDPTIKNPYIPGQK